jgi:hypothetical protein
MVVFLHLTSHAARVTAKQGFNRHARLKRDEAKQRLSLHAIRMYGLTIRCVLRMEDGDGASAAAPMQAAMLFDDDGAS